MIKISKNRFTHFLKSTTILLVAIINVVPTFAALPDESIVDFYNKNGIYYYNPAGNENNCNNSSTTLSGDTTEEKIWNYYISKGFNDAQAAGIIGNAYAETGIEATRASNSSYWGLFQWGPLKNKLWQKIRDAGLGQYLSSEYWPAGASEKIPEADYDKILEIELDFTLDEDNNDTTWQTEIKKYNDPNTTAEVFLVHFERAVGGSEAIQYYSPYVGRLYQGTKVRRDYANEVYEKYAGKGITVKNGSSSEENGANITIIGDSISVGSTSAYLDKFTELTESDINARVSRPWSEGISIAKSIELKSIVVFQLGSNSPNLTQANLDDLASIVGANRTIVLVTNYNGKNKSVYASNNQLFENFAKNNSNVIIADWATTVDQNPNLYLASDLLHPNVAGAKLLAETIYDAINSNTNSVGCSVNGEFQSLVKGYAWPEYHAAPWHERMPDYADAVTQSISEGRYVGGSVAGVPGIDCGGFVTVLVQNSGIAPDYNDTKGATGTQEQWVKDHGWTLLNASSTTAVDTSILQPGDVAFSDGHTFIYVGEIEGFDSVIASASYSTQNAGRAPMAGKEDLITGKGVTVRWYRNPDFNPYETTTTAANSVSGLVSSNAPSSSTLLDNHHITFYSQLAEENGGNAGRNASSKYNNGNLAAGQAATNDPNLPLGTVIYVQTSTSGEASYANGKYFLITDTGAGTINGDYNIDIYHEVSNSASENNSSPYGSSSTAKIYKVATGVSWETFKAKYGW